MSKLRLGDGLTLPLEIAGQTVALVGIRGSGKTNTAGVIAEELLDRHQSIVVLDPTDAWWGLRSEYPVFIFGGPKGDLPLQETDGKTLAGFVVEEQVPLILSLRHLRKAAQRRLVTDFCEELYHLKGKPEYRSPLTVFIDEAPLFVPQRVMGEVARTVGAVEDLIARGRNSGFGVVLISQRSATLNKDVLTQADTIIAHRLPSPQDRKALAEWIEENASLAEYKAVLSSLPKLATGEAWIWAPRMDLFRQAQIRPRHTFDSSAAPKVGEKIAPPKALAEIDLDKLKGKLSAAVEKARADDPKLLKQRIVALEKDLQTRKTLVTPAARVETKTIERFVLKDGQIDRVEKIADALSQILCDVLAAIKKASAPAPKPIAAPVRIAARTPQPRQVVRGSAPGESLPAGERKILTALAQYPDGRTKTQVAILTAYAHTGGGFNNYLSSLRSRGFISGTGDRLQITDDGATALGDFDPLPTGSELLQHWLRQIGKAERAILDQLAGVHPRALSKEDLGARAGYEPNGGGFNNALSRLRSLELIEGRGELKASDDLFD